MITPPRPHGGEIHLYCLTLPHAASELNRLALLLSPAETHRAAALKIDQARKDFIAGRGMLREILGGYLGCAPGDVRLTAGAEGKPFLADSGESLRFNLSHAGELLLIAVTTGAEVGIDIEAFAAGRPLDAMAHLAFSPAEQEALLTLPPSLKAEAFHRCWVRREACLKASGTGFSRPGDSFDVTPLVATPPPLTIRSGQTCWLLRDLAVPPGYCAALAVEISSPGMADTCRDTGTIRWITA